MSTIPAIYQPSTDPATGAILYWHTRFNMYEALAPGAAGTVLVGAGVTTVPAWRQDLVGSDGTSAAAAGYVGEVIQGQLLVASHVGSGFTSTQYGNVTSLSLTAGDWSLVGTLNLEAGNNWSACSAAISANSGNTTTDHVPGYNQVTLTAAQVASHINVLWATRVSATTTIYLKAALTAATMQDVICGTLTARRIR